MVNIVADRDKRTIYSSVPMQLFVTHNIKTPLIEGVTTIFSDASLVEKLKAGRKLLKVFEALKKLPEPTKENTWHPNTHRLIDLRDWLLQRCFLGANPTARPRSSFIRLLMNFAIIIYDFDPPWRWIIDSVKDKALEIPWETREYGYAKTPDFQWWREQGLP